MLHLPTSQKGFRWGFAFTYYGGEWGVPTIPLIPEPNQELMLTSNSPSWTTKALAKNRTERESTKKAKTAASVEVNSPRVGSKARETDLSLQSSNLWSLLVALLDILPATESGGRREG